MASTQPVTIRAAVAADLEEVHSMLSELIAYQKLPYPAMDLATFKRDSGLLPGAPAPSSTPVVGQKTQYFHLYVAETPDKQLAGYALFFFFYKTCKGKYIYLEDIYVKPAFRGGCVGHKMMRFLANLGLQEHEAEGMMFIVLDWNPARKFYERCGAVWTGDRKGDGWLSYEMDRDAMVRLADTLYV